MPYYPPAPVSGASSIFSVRLAANTDQDISGGLPDIDGVSPEEGDRVALIGQNDTTENGIWLLHESIAWERPTDFANGSLIPVGSLILTTEGTQYADAYFALVGGRDDLTTFVVGTSDINSTGIVDPFSWDRNDEGHTLATSGVVFPGGITVKPGITSADASPGMVTTNTVVASTVEAGTVEFGGETDTTLSRWSAGRLNLEGNLVPTIADALDFFARSTSNAIGVGNIELGHASDTTLTRAAAGRLRVAGVDIGISSDVLSFFAQSTSNTIGVGNIELGHATDTTIARSGPGAISVEGVQVILSGAALGTPSSGTLTNCTFPTLNQNTTGSAGTLTTARNLWGVSFNGSANIGGAIELGTAGTTDTTLDRSSGGVLAVEGNIVPTVNASPTWTGSHIFNAAMTLATGTTSLAPLNIPAGTVKTSPAAGDIERDTDGLYTTGGTTSGRRVIRASNLYRLTADQSAIGNTIADVFPASSAIPTSTNAVYEILWIVWFSKQTGGTVTFTVTNSQSYTNLVSNWRLSALVSASNVAGAGIVGTTTAAAALPATASLNNGANYRVEVYAIAECGTAGNIRLQATESAGTITVLRGSHFTSNRIPAANIGTFAA